MWTIKVQKRNEFVQLQFVSAIHSSSKLQKQVFRKQQPSELQK